MALKLGSIVVGAALVAASAAQAAPPKPPSAFDAQIGEVKRTMMTEPGLALEGARRAVALATAEPAGPRRDIDLATAEWLNGEALVRLKKADQAVPLLNDALAAVRRSAAGGKLEGDVIRSRGRATAATGNVQKALEDYQTAYKIYQHAGDPRGQAIALQAIGSIYQDARDYPRVLSYYAQSKDLVSKDPALSLAAHNNEGFALKGMNRLHDAEGEFRQAFQAAVALKSKSLQARILTNIAFTEAQEGKAAAARADTLKGMALSSQDPGAKDEWPFLNGVLAKLAADIGDYPESARLLNKTFAGADLAETPKEFRDFHELASGVFERTGDHKSALLHLLALKRLDDEGRALAASTNAALMSAQFDFTNQNLKIVNLKAGQLQRDMMLARSKARLNAVIAIGMVTAGGGVTVFTLIGFFSMRRSRNQIRAANEELGKSNTALEKALKAKTEFLATTSHEIRTPLNGILGMTQVILADPALPETVRERVQLMEGSGVTMRALVDDLLDMSKIENGSLVVEEKPFELRKLMTETAQFWTGQATMKGLSIKLDIDDAPRRATGDQTRLRQVLFNLMSNAIKFTDEGEITLSGRVADDALVLAVSDTGIGIPEDKHEHVFEAFAQVDSGTTRKYSGAGLGLSICRNMCSAMGGSIGVRSSPGSGSIFFVTFPYSAAVAEPEASGPVELERASLLLIDANPLSRSVMRAVLEPGVGAIDLAGRMEEVRQHFGVQASDLIVADGATLKLDGDMVAAAKSIIDLAGNGRLIVLLAPADADHASMLEAVGVSLVVMKPIAGPALAAAVKACFVGAEPVVSAAA